MPLPWLTPQVSFKYGDKNKLYVASTDGVITIYDVSQEDEDDAFIDGLFLSLACF